jgi:hypothetical protein
LNRREIARRLNQLLAYENDQTEKRWQARPKPKPPEPRLTDQARRRFKPLDKTYLRQRRAGWAARRLGLERGIPDR